MRLDYLSGGGPVPEDSPLYVERSADSDLFQSIQAGELPYVCNARQMGKTSLWGRTQKKLFEHDDSSCSVLIDINSFTPGEDYEARQWYYSFIDLLNYELKILNDDGLSHFFSKADQFLPRYSLTIFFQYLRKRSRYQRIIIGIDEIDQVLLFPRDIGIDFFKSIRACYQDNISNNSSQSRGTQIGFVLIGVAAPYDLDRNLRDDIKGTPFNLGVPIDLTGISPEKAVPVLSPGLEGIVSSPGAAIDYIVKLTGGQPFLTQKACHLIKMAARRDTSVVEKSVEELTSWTTDVIEQQIIETAWIKDHGVHFRPIQDAIINDTPDSKDSKSGRLLEFYDRLFKGESVEDVGINCIRLCLSGLTYSENGYLHIRSEIYRKVFNRSWIDKQISDLRERSGYRAALIAWEKNGQSNDYLLIGKVLKDIEQKITLSNLPDKDQDFINRSQIHARNAASEQERQARARLKIFSGLLVFVGTLAATATVVAANRISKAIELGQKIDEQEGTLDAAEVQLKEVEQEKVTVELELSRNQDELNKVRFSSQELKKENTRVKGDLAQEQKRLQVASNNLSDTQAKLITTEDSLADATIDLENAELQIQVADNEKLKAEIGTTLELSGQSVLERFGYDQIGALVSAMETGSRLKELVSDDTPISEYPATSPLYALRTVLRQVRSKNFIDYRDERFSGYSLSPDGQSVITYSGQEIKFWNLNGKQYNSTKTENPISNAYFSSDSKFLIVYPQQKSTKDTPLMPIQVLTSEGDLYGELHGHERNPSRVLVNAESRKIITLEPREHFHSTDVLRVWDFSGELITAFFVDLYVPPDILSARFDSSNTSLSLSPGGQKIIGKTKDIITIWDLEGNVLARQHSDLLEIVNNGKYILNKEAEDAVGVYDTDSFEFITGFRDASLKIDDVKVSNDGQFIAVNFSDGIYIYDNVQNDFIGLIAETDAPLQFFRFNNNSRQIITLHSRSLLKVWDTVGNLVGTIDPITDGIPVDIKSVNLLDVSSTGEHILSLEEDSTPTISGIDGENIGVIRENIRNEQDLRFSPDGKYIYYRDFWGKLSIWDLKGKLLLNYDEDFDSGSRFYRRIHFAKDGYVVIPDAGRIALFNLNSPNGSTLVKTGEGNTSREYANVAINNNADRVVSIAPDGTANIFDADGDLLNSVQIVERGGDNDGSIRITSSFATTTIFADGEVGGTITTDLPGSSIGPFFELDFSADGNFFVVAPTLTTHHHAFVYDDSGNLVSELKGHEDDVRKAKFSRNGQRVLTSSGDSTARLWTTTGDLLATFSGHQDTIPLADLSFDGSYVVTGAEKEAKLWTSSGNMIASFQHPADVLHVGLSPNAELLITTSSDNKARLWKRSGELLVELKGHLGSVISAAFSPDGRFVITSSADGTARLWNTDGDTLAVMSGHPDEVHMVNFSQDGQRIITASEDGTTHIWDNRGRQLMTVEHDSSIHEAVFSPDGRYVLTALEDGTVHISPLDTIDELLELSCQYLSDYIDSNLQADSLVVSQCQ